VTASRSLPTPAASTCRPPSETSCRCYFIIINTIGGSITHAMCLVGVGPTGIIHCTMQCSTFVRNRMMIADEAALRAWLLLGTTRQGLMRFPLVSCGPQVPHASYGYVLVPTSILCHLDFGAPISACLCLLDQERSSSQGTRYQECHTRFRTRSW
jgi:hypothetical protein